MVKKTIKIISLLLLVAVVVGIGILYSPQKTLRGYFDNWVSEKEEDIVFEHSGYIGWYDKETDLESYISGRIEEIYCILNDRIYLCYSKYLDDSRKQEEWHIASIGIHEKDVQEHYSECLTTNPETHLERDYGRLQYDSNRRWIFGGFYRDKRIYLKGKDKTVVYDMLNDTIEEINSLPTEKYHVEIDQRQKMIVEDCESGEQKIVTLGSMAEKNQYAKKLLDMSGKKIWSDKSPTEEFFADVKVSGEDIYILGCVRNWHGSAFAVIFKYDFQTDAVYYLAFKKYGGQVHGSCYIVDVETEDEGLK